MKVLVIGSGGREHALAWKCAQSELVSEVLVAPGNAGTAREAKTRNVDRRGRTISTGSSSSRARSGLRSRSSGPEPPLVAGIVDRFERDGLKCFGPNAAGAQLEGSKAFTKEFLARHRIPTAAYQAFTDLSRARDYVRTRTPPIVIKADGLAAGKGVVIAPTVAEAEATLERMLEQRQFGAAGSKVVIEDFMQGEEASFIALVDGTRVVPLASSQDHKTRDDARPRPEHGRHGRLLAAPGRHRLPSTGTSCSDIMLPTVRGLMADGIRYRGFLYAGS